MQLSYRIAKNRVFWASGNRLVESYRRTDKIIFNSSHNLPLKFVYIVKFAEKKMVLCVSFLVLQINICWQISHTWSIVLIHTDYGGLQHSHFIDLVHSEDNPFLLFMRNLKKHEVKSVLLLLLRAITTEIHQIVFSKGEKINQVQSPACPLHPKI